MAAIDKIYVENWEQYTQFKNWCKEQPKLKDKYGKEVSLTSYVYDHTPNDKVFVAFSGPYYLDAYIIRNCPFDFIQEELMVNYGYWSQSRIKEYYDDVKNWSGEGECPYWAKIEDFITLEDGTMTIKGLEKSSYERIKEGELYTSPKRSEYKTGKHFRCIRHPKVFYNRPFKCKGWFVSVELPETFNEYMWYHSNTNTWDFSSEFVVSDWSSNVAIVKTIKTLERLMLKWKLPIGTKVRATGRYTFDNYEFIITK